MIRLATMAVAAAALCVTPALAQFPGQAPAAPAFPGQATGFQVTRPTDGAMTCEQILAEANPLNELVTQQKQAAAAKLAEEQAAAEKAASGLRVAGNLLGGALALGAQAGMMRGMMNNPLARQAVTAASQGAGAIQANANAQTPAAPAAPAPPTVEEQRMAVLLALYTEKRCGG
jgi:hypothetical protein